jgi:hypothetical protein
MRRAETRDKIRNFQDAIVLGFVGSGVAQRLEEGVDLVSAGATRFVLAE